jgi:type I restriction enzyme M protein
MENWIYKRYQKMQPAFQENEFRFEDAAGLLKKEFGDEEKQVLTILSTMKKEGYLDVKKDSENARRKIYTLLKPNTDIVKGIGEGERLTRDDVEKILKRGADLIRTRVDYKFILVLLFLKRISDKWQKEYNDEYKKAIADGFSEKEAKKEAGNEAYHDFVVPEKYLGENMNFWDNIRNDVAHLPERFSEILKEIGDRNPKIREIVSQTSFIQFSSNKENSELLRQLVELFSEKRLSNVSDSVLGDSYEWIVRYFAPQKAKEGEVYTPKEVIWLMIQMLEPKSGEEIYDPAAGAANMLVQSYKYVQEKEGENKAKTLSLYGEEANAQTVALAQMNLYIHGIKQSQIKVSDTLKYPKFEGKGGGPKPFDLVLINPPWNQDGYPEENLKKGNFAKERFTFGYTPNQSADWAWIQHVIASLNEKGRAGIVIDNGALFRGGKEGTIRQAVLEAGLIECVILLPEKLFYNTGAPGGIIIINKNRQDDKLKKVLFINSSESFEKHPDVRKLNILSDKNIAAIKEAYVDFKEKDGFRGKKGYSRVVDISEIEKNGWSLNVTMYVSREEEIEEIDTDAVWKEIKEIEKKLGEKEKKIEGYLKEIK